MEKCKLQEKNDKLLLMMDEIMSGLSADEQYNLVRMNPILNGIYNLGREELLKQLDNERENRNN